MASVSWNDHDSAPAVPTPQAPGKRWGRVLRQIGWTSAPIWSLGFLSFVPFLAFAVIQRRKRDWAVFAGYLLATVALVATGDWSTPTATQPRRPSASSWSSWRAAQRSILVSCSAPDAPSRSWRQRGGATKKRCGEPESESSAAMTRGAWFRRIRRWPASSGSAGPTCRGSTTTAAWWDVNRVPGAVLAASLGSHSRK
jgi:hypothetical protein